MEETRVLIVENEFTIAHKTEQFLEELGYQVTSIVSTGEEAVKKALLEKLDIILMDFILAGEMDGIDTASIIRTRFNIPVVFLADDADDHYLEKAKLTYPYGFLVKPVRKRDLKVTLEMALHSMKQDAIKRGLDEERDLIISTLRQSNQQDESNQNKYYSLFDESPVGYLLLDKTGKILESNKTFSKMIGIGKSKIKQKSFTDFILTDEYTTYRFNGKNLDDLTREGDVISLKPHGGDEVPGGMKVFNINDTINGSMALREISYLVVAVYDVLRFQQRLEESNTALKVLLEKNAESKSELEKIIYANVKHSILPSIDAIKQQNPDSEIMSHLNSLEDNLNELVSPFLKRLYAEFQMLTPSEIRIANYIRDDKGSKEIAELLGCSKQTVDFHRRNIRQKLGLTRTKTNLKTFLLSYSE